MVAAIVALAAVTIVGACSGGPDGGELDAGVPGRPPAHPWTDLDVFSESGFIVVEGPPLAASEAPRATCVAIPAELVENSLATSAEVSVVDALACERPNGNTELAVRLSRPSSAMGCVHVATRVTQERGSGDTATTGFALAGSLVVYDSSVEPEGAFDEILTNCIPPGGTGIVTDPLDDDVDGPTEVESVRVEVLETHWAGDANDGQNYEWHDAVWASGGIEGTYEVVDDALRLMLVATSDAIASFTLDIWYLDASGVPLMLDERIGEDVGGFVPGDPGSPFDVTIPLPIGLPAESTQLVLRPDTSTF